MLGLPERQRSNLSSMDPDSARQHPLLGQECSLSSCSRWTVGGAGTPFWQKYRPVSICHWNPMGQIGPVPSSICLSKKHLSQVCLAMPAVSGQMRHSQEINSRLACAVQSKTVSKKMPTVCLIFMTIYFSPLYLRKIILVKWIVKLLIHNRIKIILSS